MSDVQAQLRQSALWVGGIGFLVLVPSIGFLSLVAIVVLAVTSFDAGVTFRVVSVLTPLVLVAALTSGIAYGTHLTRNRPVLNRGLGTALKQFATRSERPTAARGGASS